MLLRNLVIDKVTHDRSLSPSGSYFLNILGTEMGQGLHVKTIQVASEILQIDSNLIRINETATDKIPNASSTAGSASSDLYGNATKLACQQINERLKPLREEFSEYNWFELISAAYYRRINLSAEGYFTTGCACSEVEIDALTGDFHILRTDILMDFGLSMNPNIDIGQIEGAFMQGVGMVTMEELIWGDEQHKWLESGCLFTQGPGTYKIPSFNDVPIDFRISLFKNAPNPFAIFSSKGVGEPGITLSTTVFFAIKKAIESYRQDNGFDEYFILNSPATCEKIRMACADVFTKEIIGEDKYEKFQPNGSY
jgi:xanthine dehydrogenase/oxidase